VGKEVRRDALGGKERALEDIRNGTIWKPDNLKTGCELKAIERLGRNAPGVIYFCQFFSIEKN